MDFLSLSSIAKALQSREVSSVEVTQFYLDRIMRHDPALNSFITVTPEQALAQAQAADARLAKGEGTMLTGVPMAHKDLVCTKGVKTTCGSKMLENFVAPYDAHIVERCQSEGLISLGKTNLDEFAMGSSNESSYFGPTKNPWDINRIPGGSSGGSAAAVAANLTPVTTGTDTGGSIRQPCAMCNLTGIKPTYGRVSRYGIVAYASSLDQAGPMARSAEDCALFLNVIAGHDQRDSTSSNRPEEDFTSQFGKSLDGLKIGVPDEYFSEGLDPSVEKVIRSALALYESMGAKLVPVHFEYNHLCMPAYYVIAPAEASSNLSRYDGVRYGYRCDDASTLTDLYEGSRSDGFGHIVKQRILVGTYALSSGFYDAYYVKAQKIRRLVAQDFERAFESVDVIMGPTSPVLPFKLGERAKDPVSMYLADTYTLAVNMSGLPGMSIPAGFVDDLPVGLQLIGPAFQEAKLLNIAHQYQLQTDWHLRIPEAYRD